MRVSATLNYDKTMEDWVVWVGQEAHEVFNGMEMEIQIKDSYYEAYLERSDQLRKMVVTLEQEVDFILKSTVSYNVRISDHIIYLHPEWKLPL